MTNIAGPENEQSDKGYWHNYIQFYELFFKKTQVKEVAEIGVYRGASVKWLLDRFPDARIDAADILPEQNCWPKSPRVIYSMVDQASEESLKRFFSKRMYDLVIEDGSHVPEHQKQTLVQGLKAVNQGGLYILEDAHTAHPGYKKGIIRGNKLPNIFTFLVGLAHLKSRNLPESQIEGSKLIDGFIDIDEAREIFRKLKNIHLYKRTILPSKCYRCHESNFNLGTLRCVCGASLFDEHDSMAFVLEVN